MEHVLLFLIWIIAAFLLPELLGRLRIPWLTSVILVGIIFGPYGFELIQPTETIDFLARLGLIFLMFLGGLEVKTSEIKRRWREVFYFTSANFLLPLAIGFIVGLLLNLPFFGIMMLGICASSSFVGVIIPILMDLKVETRVLSTVATATFIEDLISLILATVIIEVVEQSESISLLFFPFILIALIVFTLHITPRLYKLLLEWFSRGDVFESDTGATLLIIALTAFITGLIGVHEITGAFLAGVALSDMLEKRVEIKSKIFSISYGFLVPMFLLSLGFTINIRLLLSPENALTALIIVTSFIAGKIIGGFIGAKIQSFNVRESIGMGIATVPRLSVALAVASIARSHGLFNEDIIASLLIMAIITILVSPTLTKIFLGSKAKVEERF